MVELYELPQIVASRSPRALERAAQAVPQPHARDRVPRARGGRARQAVHQHLALHQVRGRQPALHDGQRLRPRLRAHPLGARRTTTRVPPTCPRAGFAAGPCLFKDTMQLAAFNNNNFHLGQASVLDQRGPAPLRRRPARAALRPLDDDGRHPRHVVQGGVRRHPLEPQLQAEADPAVQGRAVCSPTIRTSPSTPISSPLDEVLRESDLLVIGTPHADVPRARDRQCRSSTSGTCASAECRCDEPDEPRVSVVIPVYNEGEAIVALPRPHPRRASRCRARCSSSTTTTADTHRRAAARSTPRPTPVWCRHCNTYGPGPARAIRYGIDHARAPGRRGHDGRRQRRRRADRRALQARRARRGRRGGVALHERRPAGRRTRPQERCCRGWPGSRCSGSARVGTRDATNSFKAYSVEFVRDVGIESDTGFEIGIELVAKARRLRLPGRRDPHDLARARPRRVELQGRRSGSRGTCSWYRFAFGPELSLDAGAGSRNGTAR